jgi:hypothetical protein
MLEGVNAEMKKGGKNVSYSLKCGYNKFIYNLWAKYKGKRWRQCVKAIMMQW